MPDFNRVILAGNLTRDPETRNAGGTTVCNFGLAINRRWRDRDGQQQEETTFVDCTAWGRTGEALAEHQGKGDAVLVEGRLTLDRWQDREGGNRQKLKVTAERIQFLGGGRGRDGNQSGRQQRHEPETGGVDPDTVPF